MDMIQHSAVRLQGDYYVLLLYVPGRLSCVCTGIRAVEQYSWNSTESNSFRIHNNSKITTAARRVNTRWSLLVYHTQYVYSNSDVPEAVGLVQREYIHFLEQRHTNIYTSHWQPFLAVYEHTSIT